jgi:hypothetical protein
VITDRVAGKPAAGTVAPPRRRFRPPGRRASLVLGLVLVVTTASLAVWLARRPSGPETPVAPQWQRTAVTADGLPDRSGVQLLRVALTGGGGLLDLRFKVVDPNKAASIHDPRTPPALIDERTGLVLNQLLMDHAHTGDFQAALTYYLVFENTGGWVHRGDALTVLLGDAQVGHVVVQ